jgi:hypothetical protein
VNAYDLGLHQDVLAAIPRQPASAEKRRHPRRQLNLRCWMQNDDHTLYGRIYDLSMGGLSMRVPVPFSVGAHLSVALGVSSPSEGRIVPLRAIACVVWLRAAELGPTMGTRFVDFPEGDDVLRRLMIR